jgi:hypothetical protein
MKDLFVIRNRPFYNRIFHLLKFSVFILIFSCDHENYPPTAILSVWPTSGSIPLKVHIKLTGSDSNGREDIVWYSLNIDNQIIKSKYLIDTSIIFFRDGIFKISGEVIDTKNQSNKSNIIQIDVYFTCTYYTLEIDKNYRIYNVKSRDPNDGMAWYGIT